ncbi:MAG: LCP family protein [Saccharofermentanales bacterium]
MAYNHKAGASRQSGTAKKRRRRTRRIFSIKNILLSVLSFIIIFSFFIIAYIYKLMAQNEQTIIPIVESHTISEGMLDHMSDPNEDEEESNSATSASSVKVQTYWGNGRVKVFVDPRFPIIRVEQKDPDVENFLIFGIDSRSADEQKARTDSMIIVTLDKKYNTIKLTSILRDTKVKIPGRTIPSKINAAYAFGGVGLMVNTINENFGLDIQRFAMVDMWSAESVIDAMGGISLNVTPDEVEYVNDGIRETNRLFSKSSERSPYISESGLLLLNGRQTVAYGRIRKIGSDLGRTARQRKVLTEMVRQFKASALSRKMSVLDLIVRSFESNVNKNDMVFLAVDVFSLMKNITQYRLPSDGMYTTNTDNWQITIDYEKQLPALHGYIWGPSDMDAISLPEESPEPDSSISDSSLNDSLFDSSADISRDSSDISTDESCISCSGEPLPTVSQAMESEVTSEMAQPTLTPEPYPTGQVSG